MACFRIFIDDDDDDDHIITQKNRVYLYTYV